MAGFEEWESFYVIVGAAAGALIGLQFVVMTLIAERPQLAAPDAGAAFATPTVVHFGAALLLSALQRVPWHEFETAALAWGLVGLAGTVYMVIVGLRMRRQRHYQPDWEDWIFHLALPLLSYAALALSALLAHAHPEEALLTVAAMTLVLLFIGIHNSWDTIAYNVFVRMRDSDS
ncbi:MAG TPA: hypothetical protein VNU64_12295 [Burkholderiales bacterium]|nr:hypothetical protein [Burkholderiales bacterium]